MKKIYFVLAGLLFSIILQAQNVGIGTTTPTTTFSVAEKFQVDVNGNILKLNNVTTTFPAANASGVLTNNGSGTLTWAALGGSSWGLTGNAATVDGTNFIGTTDNIPFTIRVNNQKAGRIDAGTAGNTFFGYQSGNVNSGNNFNTGIGQQALFSNTTGVFNTANGYAALYSNTTGSNNTAIGNNSLYTQSFSNGGVAWSSFNTALGREALYFNQPTATSNGINNTALGYRALYSNSTGGNNTAIGYQSLLFNNTGFQNTAVGSPSMFNNTTGSYNTAVGYNTGPNSGNLFNTNCFGIDATGTANDQVRIGNTFVNSIGGQVGWTTLSDARFKENVTENVPGLNFITQLRPVTYQLSRNKINDFTGVTMHRNKTKEKNPDTEFLSGDNYSGVTTGFIAQEVEAAAKKLGFDFSGVDAPKNENDMYGLRYAEFVVPLVKAVQELKTIIDEQKKQLELLKAEIEKLKSAKKQ